MKPVTDYINLKPKRENCTFVVVLAVWALLMLGAALIWGKP